MLRALNDAIADGRFCLRRPLMTREELRCDAYRLATPLALAESDAASGGGLPSWVAMTVGWHAVPDGSGRAWWATLEAATVDEAANAMLSADSQEICESAMHVPYKWVAVAHVFDSWVVELKADMP